jgi:hypothetical protein
MSRRVVLSNPRSRKSANAVSSTSRRVASLAARWGTARTPAVLNMFKDYGVPTPIVNMFLNAFKMH